MLHFRQRGVAAAERIGDLPEWLSTLLRNRGIDTPEKAQAFLHPSLDDLHDPYLMQDMDRCVELLRRAAEEGQRVIVYGDYDVDGICATSIMLETLREAGVTVDYRLPSRHTEGYGLNEKAVREMAEDHQLLLTVDCGISNAEEVRLARLLGMTVIVTDHHEPPEILPQADAVLNPLLGEYPFRRLCGAGVALKITQALLGMDAVRRRIDLAALATVADIVTLVDENRVIVSAGLAAMSSSQRPGLIALMRTADVHPPVNAGHLGFRLAPRLNAGGRLESAGRGVELLTASSAAEAEALAAHLEESNRERQAVEQATVEQAETLLRQQNDWLSDRILIVAGEGWNSGVIGLAAGRLCERYHFPTIVLAADPVKGTAVGSCRSIPGVDIHAALTSCKDLFERYGGHVMAAGLTIKIERIPELRRRLNLFIRETVDERCYIPVKEYDLRLPFAQVDEALIDRLSLLQPTGYGNPAPVFLAEGAFVQAARRVGADASHLKISLMDASETVLDGIAFRQGDFADSGARRADLLFEPEMNEFRGRRSPQLQIKALRAASGASPVPEADRFWDSFLKEIPHLQEFSPEASNKEDLIPAAAPLTRAGLRKLTAGGLGVLILCREGSLAGALAQECTADTAVGRVADERCFNTVLCAPQLMQLTDSWHHIVLADGDLLPGQAALLHRLCPRAALHALPANPAWKDCLREALPDVETQRALWLTCRNAQPRSLRELSERLGLSRSRTVTALALQKEAGLLDWAAEPFRVRLIPGVKASPMDTPTARYLAGFRN